MTDKPTKIRPFSMSDVQPLPPGQRQKGGLVAGRGEIYYPDAEQRAIVRMDQPQARRPALQGDIMPPIHQVDTPTPVRTAAAVSGDYRNRAEGFRVAMTPVAIVAGVLAVTAAVGLAGVPFLSFATMLWFFTAFCVTWLVGFVLHTWVSPDGTALTMVLLHYRLLRNEQDARLDRLDRWGGSDDDN